MRDEIVIKSGETVSFPVDADHAFAKFQTLAAPAQIANLAELAIAQRIVATRTDGQPLEHAIESVLRSASVNTILDVTLPDLVIEAGATMILNGPISKLSAGTLTVIGEIRAYGSLNLTCESLGGARLPVVTGLSVNQGPALGDTKVTISGQNFDNLSAVYFGEQVSTTALVVNETQVEAYSPAGVPGAVHVTVVTHGAFRSQNTPADLFTYSPAVSGIAITPNPLWTGDPGVGVVTLDRPAPAGGLPIALTAGALGQGVPGLDLPSSVVVPEGATSAQFQVTSTAPMQPTIVATTAAGSSSTVDLAVYSGTVALIVNLEAADAGPYLVAGQSAPVTALVRQAAPSAGASISVSTNSQGLLSVPAQVALPPGAKSASFTIQASNVLPPRPVIAFLSASYQGGSAMSEEFKLLKDYPPATQ